MVIRRVIAGKEVVIPLTDDEVEEIYKANKTDLAFEQVHDYLSALEVGDIFRVFGTETEAEKFNDDQMEKLEESILQDRELLLSIHAQFAEYQSSKLDPEYSNDMDSAIDVVLNKWAAGKVFSPEMFDGAIVVDKGLYAKIDDAERLGTHDSFSSNQGLRNNLEL